MVALIAAAPGTHGDGLQLLRCRLLKRRKDTKSISQSAQFERSPRYVADRKPLRQRFCRPFCIPSGASAELPDLEQAVLDRPGMRRRNRLCNSRLPDEQAQFCRSCVSAIPQLPPHDIFAVFLPRGPPAPIQV